MNYAADIWGERVQIGRSDIATVFDVGPKYREYGFMGFDIVFNDEIPDLTIWTGGYPVFVKGAVITAGDGQIFQESDLDIMTEDGKSVIGTELEKGVKYTFKIRIQSDNPDNGAFGVAASSDAGQGSFYIGFPYFQK